MACSGTSHAGTKAHDCWRTRNALHAHSPPPWAFRRVGRRSNPPYPPLAYSGDSCHLIRCKAVGLCESFSCPWPPWSPFDTRLSIEQLPSWAAAPPCRHCAVSASSPPPVRACRLTRTPQPSATPARLGVPRGPASPRGYWGCSPGSPSGQDRAESNPRRPEGQQCPKRTCPPEHQSQARSQQSPGRW